MKTKEYITELAAKLGIEKSDIELADRYLAAAGLRQKASGRAVPDITTREALRILLGIMAARQPSQVVDDVLDVERFKLMAHGIMTERGSAENLKTAIGVSVAELEKMHLIDALERIAQFVGVPENQHFSPVGDPAFADVYLEVIRSGVVSLKVDGGGFMGKIVFSGAMDLAGSHEFHQVTTLGANAFAWIGRVTAVAND